MVRVVLMASVGMRLKVRVRVGRSSHLTRIQQPFELERIQM